MFWFHLLRNLRTYLKNELVYYRLVRRLENPDIRKPFFVISPERLKIGKNVLIQRYNHFHCGGMPWSIGKGSITVGDNCWFSENNILYGAGEIEIGDWSGMGPGAMVFSSRDDYSLKYAKLPHIVHQFGKITIGSYVRIFSSVVISPGVTIGDGAVIGANSVILHDIPPWTIAAGNPARVIRERGEDIPLSSRKPEKRD